MNKIGFWIDNARTIALPQSILPALFAISLGSTLGILSATNPKEVDLPNVVGMTKEAAKEKIESAKLKFEIQNMFTVGNRITYGKLTTFCPLLGGHDLINSVDYIIKKYGKIDFLESNNEFWLENDATLREWFSIDSGIYRSDILKFKAKSEMKKYFAKGNVKCAKSALSDSYESVLTLVEEVGYPIFVKPNIGVGASGTRRIKNIDDLNRFFAEKDNNQYIFEQFIDGCIYSFDGITNSKGEIIFKTAHKFLEVNDLISPLNNAREISTAFWYSSSP